MPCRSPYIFGGIALIFLISVINTVNAQFRRIGLREGISNNSITAIYQDNHGFMWLGTFDGLNRYDGHQFKIFKNKLNDSLSLPNNRITAIAEDGDHHLWVGTKRGPYRLDQKRWTFHPIFYLRMAGSIISKLTNPVNCFLKAADGSLFIGSAGAGLLLKDRAKDFAVQIPFYDHQQDKEPVYKYHIQAIIAMPNGEIQVFVQDHGIARYDSQTKKLMGIDRSIRQANCLFADRKGRLWLGNNNGLFQYQVENGKIIGYKAFTTLGSYPVVAITADQCGTIWIGTDGGGVARIDGDKGTIRRYSAGDGAEQLSSAAIYAIYADHADRKWIGTLRGGINLMDKMADRFAHVQRSPNARNTLSSNFILSFCEGDKDEIWIGTDGAGLTRWNRSTRTFTHYKHQDGVPHSISNDYVVRIERDRDGMLWIATYGGGMNRFDPQTKQFKFYPCYNTKRGHEDVNIWGLYQDKAGDIWVGTLSDGGLYRYNRVSDCFELFDDRLTNLLAFTEDDDGNLWAGDFHGLVKIDRVHKQHIWYPLGQTVRSIQATAGNQLWLATEGGGLKRFDKQTGACKTFSETDGLPENAVLNILEANNGNLWVSTFNGLSEFNPQKETFRNFYVADGLQSNQFNYNAALKLKSGELLFGGINGFNIFDPAHIKPLSVHAPTWITGIRVNNKPIETTDINWQGNSVSDIRTLDLSYDKAVLSVEFAALAYSFQDKINYAFYLEGWENNWNYVEHNRTANYGKLPPGKYTLHIRASDEDGKWNGQERLLQINVASPWWATTWAYLFYGCCLGGIVYQYSRYRRRSVELRYEVAKAKLEKEKEHELHEKKINFFTHVSHELRTPLTLIINPLQVLLSKNNVPDKDMLQTIFRNSKRLLSMVNQLLLFKKAASDEENLRIVQFDLRELCQEICACYKQQAQLAHISFALEMPDELDWVYADREKIEIILFNLLTNAFKFTPQGGTVRLMVKHIGQEICLSVEDSGCGIAEEQQQTLFTQFSRHGQSKQSGFGIGLYLSKKFAELHLGTLTYQNKDAGGVIFTLTLLAGKDHWANRLIYEDVAGKSMFLDELLAITTTEPDKPLYHPTVSEGVVDKRPFLMIVDDHQEIADYLFQCFEHDFTIHVYHQAEEALQSLKDKQPDVILCDVMMNGMDGLQFYQCLKEHRDYRHIPLIFLTASTSEENKLRGIALGAADYISKPFNHEHLHARIHAILKQRQQQTDAFYEDVTLARSTKISNDEARFLERCERLILENLYEEFTIKDMAANLGMSHSALYKKIKTISGRTANEFTRWVKLRKAAQTLLREEVNINEVTVIAGFNDVKYFREQFQKEFGMKPSAYAKRYRDAFQKKYQLG